jgi:hypothetical protein
MTLEKVNKNSGVLGKAPEPWQLKLGEIGVNWHPTSPFLSIKDGNGTVRTISFVAGNGGGTGTVTSVGLSLPSGLFSVTGSPVTSLGTLTANLATQSANLVFAGPSSGSAAAPTFRQLNYSELAGRPQFGAAAFLNVGTQAGTVAAGDAVSAILSRLAALQHANCLYVAESGSDSNSGAVDAPLASLRAAAALAQPGDVVFVAPGLYIETILPIRWRRDVTIFGSGLRSTVVQPAAGQEFNDVFKVDSGFWCWGITFAGHQADNTRQAWAVSFDELADNRSIGAIGLGAYVFKSPYIQNCSSITAEDDSGLAGSVSTGNTGGGIRVDGSVCTANSPIRSMVVDSYTQVNLGGPGCLVLNDGYAQLVSFFGTFCTYHVRCETGGQVNLSGGGTSDFGIYGLMADGQSRSPLYTGSARVAAYGALRAEKTVTIDTSTDLFTCTGHTLVAGDQVMFSATQGTLPTGLVANQIYYVIASGLTANAFRVSATPSGSTIDMSGSATGAYQFLRQGATEIDVTGFTANRLGRQIKYPTAGSLGSAGNAVTISARGGSTAGSSFTVTLATSTITHEFVGGGTVTVSGTSYPITSASYNNSTGQTVLTASGYAPTIGASVTLSGLSFSCSSASRPNAGQLMFPQLVFPRNATTKLPESKSFAYTRTGNFTLTFTEAAAASGPDHQYVSGGSAVISDTDYGVADAVYDKNTGLVTLTTKTQLPAGNGNVTVSNLAFFCPSSAYIVTSSVPIDASGNPVANDAATRAGYRVLFYSGLNGGLRDAISAGQKLDFRNRSQISAPGHTFEFVGAGTNYDALPWNGGVPVPANAIVETNNGRVYSSNTNELGDFAVGSQFKVDGTSGSVTINTDQFNLSGLNFIGPFSRNGGISTVGEQLREVSNNTSLLASTGASDGNTAPTQFAVRSFTTNRFLADVTATSGQPLTVTDTSTQDSGGYWTRSRNIELSFNAPNGLARLDGSGLIPSTLLPSTDAVSEGSVNLYFTQSRARQSISGSGSITYDPVTGVIGYSTPSSGAGSGSVTSVGLSLPSQFSVSGSPVTGSGTLTAAWENQSANLIFAGPATGSAAAPSFRAGVPADVGLGSSSTPTFAGVTATLKLTLPNGAPASPTYGDLYSVADTLRYRDSTNTERLLLNAADNLANLSNQATARSNLGLGTSSTPQFAELGLGTAAVSGWDLVIADSLAQRRLTVTASSGTYSLNVQAGNEFVTSAAIAGATTINLANLANIPSGYLWRGVLSFAYTSGTISWFTGNSGYTVKWDGGSAMTPTASQTEKIVIEVVGGTTTIEVAPLKGRA